MGRELLGIKGKEAIKALIRAGGIERPGKGNHVNIKMPNGKQPEKQLKSLLDKCPFMNFDCNIMCFYLKSKHI
ncbi:MAG: hypothetical protein AB1480_10820 [Nitrospirota bacterium]